MDNIGFKPPFVNNRGSNTVYVQERGQWKGPRVQLFQEGKGMAPMVPFGISEQESGKSISVGINDPEMQAWLRNVDEHVLQAAQTNCQQWFGKTYDRATLEAFYRTLLSPTKEGLDPLLRLKITTWGKDTDTKIWVQTPEGKVVKGTLSDLQPRCRVVPIAMFNTVWFVQNSFGLSLVATDILIVESPDSNPNAFDMTLPFDVTPCPEADPPITVSHNTPHFGDFDLSTLSYQAPAKNPYGGITVWLRHPIRRVQFPQSEVPFGVSVSEEDATRKSFSVRVTDEAFQSWCAQLDEMNLTNAVDSSEQWFNKKMPRGVVENFYRKIVSEPTKEGYAPLLRLKITNKTRFWKLGEGNVLQRATEDDLTPHSIVVPTAEPSSLWFVQNSFGLSFHAMSVLIVSSGEGGGIGGGGGGAAASGDFILAQPAPAAPATDETDAAMEDA